MKRWWAVVVAAGVVLAAVVVSSGSLAATDVPGLAARVAALRSVERVRWSHREWPASNPGPKPGLDEVVSGNVFRERVLEALAMSLALERYWNRPLVPAQLQAELDRMARETRAPERLRELFAAVGNDPALAAEVIARPVLAERLLRGWYAEAPPADAAGEDGRSLAFDAWWVRERPRLVAEIEADPSRVRVVVPGDGLVLPSPRKETATEEGSWSRIHADVPDPTTEATAIWTGSEMIVWGGRGEHPSNAGWRYDPATDSWCPLTMDDAPIARSGHAAVWTGKELIVWGGQGSSRIGYLGDGARYHPVADMWKPISADGAPTARTEMVFAWTGSELIVWGGRGSDGAMSGGALYDPETDAWRPMSDEGAPGITTENAFAWTGSELFVWRGSWPYLYDPVLDSWRRGSKEGAPPARNRGKAAWTGSCVVVWGGGSSGTSARGDGGCYDPDTDSWTSLPDDGAPAPRYDHGLVWAGDRLVVWGGLGSDDNPRADGGAWIESEDRWVPLSTEGAPSPRFDHVMVWTGDEVIAWGGKDRKWNGEYLRTGGRYDPRTDSWVPTRWTWDGPGPRWSYPGVWTGSEFVVWGGRSMDTILADGASWDPATASWTPIPGGPYRPSARATHEGVWTGREVVYWGGVRGVLADPDNPLGDGGRWDPVSRRWLPMATRGAPSPRYAHTMVWTGREAIVWGGHDFQVSLNDGAAYDPRTDTWRPVPSCPWWPLGIREHRAVWTGRWMVVWGGEEWDPQHMSAHLVDRGGRYDPEADTWEPVTTDGMPEHRLDHEMVWTGEEVLVWGGMAGTALRSGGRYDPWQDLWRPMSEEGAPSARYFHALVWTGRRMVTWGGYDLDTVQPLRSGGSWDPETDRWEPLPAAGAPRATERMGWAWTGSEFVVWGGRPTTADGGTLHLPCGDFAWYRDADGDGHGDPADRVDACTAPEGYVAFGDDCDDGDPLRYPGRPEACNGIDDDCDGTVDGDVLPPPGWVDLRVVREGTEGTRLSWAPLAGADAYDADRGDLGTLLANGSLFDSVDGCLANDTAATEAADPDPVDPGGGRWYLVRGLNCGGPGTFNVGGPRQSGDRDGQLVNAPNGCP